MIIINSVRAQTNKKSIRHSYLKINSFKKNEQSSLRMTFYNFYDCGNVTHSAMSCQKEYTSKNVRIRACTLECSSNNDKRCFELEMKYKW
jgi:hypothetical protein